MQLFSIGLYELNLDGSRKTDTSGNWIPTYDQEDIKQIQCIHRIRGFRCHPNEWVDILFRA
jgi:hypothetical protein